MRIISLLVVVVFLLSLPVTAFSELPMIDYDAPRAACPILQAVVDDPEPPLNIRSSPEVRPDNIIGTLQNGFWLSIQEISGDWFRVPLPNDSKNSGWVVRSRTYYDCTFFREEITLPALIEGKILGGGTHKYVFNLTKGQKFSIRAIDPYKDYPKDIIGIPIVTDALGKPLPSYRRIYIDKPYFVNSARKVPAAYDAYYRCFSKDGKTCPDDFSWIVEESGQYILSLDSNFKGFNYQIVLGLEDP